MALLTALVTHLGPEATQATLRHLERVAPGARVVVCHGGTRNDFDRIDTRAKVFVEDSDLRAAPITIQSYNQLLRLVWQESVRDDPAIEAVCVLEYDQVVLCPDYETRILDLLVTSGADFLGKNCVDRTQSNWVHYLRYRDDPGLLAFLRAVSVRNDKERMFGCLGTGLVLRRAVLEALATMEHFRPAYIELYLPTLVHHLGFKVDDAARLGDCYDHLRWAPPYEVEDVLALKTNGACFVHPLKDWRVLSALTAD